MTGIVLHSYRRCPFAIRVRMTLEEKGLEYSVIEEDLAAPTAELLRLHPEGAVPLLIHDGFAIHESAIITEYLDEVFPSPRLVPAVPAVRARLRLWTYWCNHLFKPDLDAYKYEWRKLDEQGRARLLERVRGHVARLEGALSETPFLLGAELTLADVHVFPFYRQLVKAQPDFADRFPRGAVDAWLEKIVARGSFERVMAKPA